MRCSLKILAAAVCVGTLGGTAVAADLPARTPPPPLPPVPSLPFDFTGGFYVRVDGGVGFNDRPSLSIHPGPVGRAAVSLGDPNYRGKFTSSDFPRARLGNGKFGDIGVGYQLTNFFRFDVTGEFRGDMKLGAVNLLADRGATTGPFGTLKVRNSTMTSFVGQLNSAIFLANGYVDLGNYWGFSPFVGAGIGAARNSLGTVKENLTVATRIGNAAPISGSARGFLDSRGHTSIAWAAMAGVAYDITPNLKLEVAYRYLDFGRLRSGGEHIILPTGVVGQPFVGRSRDLVSNDVKVGLRWSFNVAPPPPPPQEPLTRRY